MKSLHLELTNRCTLECPGCPRTQWRDLVKKPVEKMDLDINSLEKFLDCPGGQAIQEFLICGDYGDAIYYPALFDFLKKFRNNKTYVIYTNGSWRDNKFWTQLSEILTAQDTVIFSIDGLENTNHIYRRNSDWKSIMVGVDIMAKSSATLRWKTIIFNYNINQLPEIKKFAEDKGAIFTAEKTHRFGDNSLVPDDVMVETNYLFKPEYLTDDTLEIVPKCQQERTVTCDGYLFPCDWIRNPRTLYKSQLWKQKNRWIDKLKIADTDFDTAMGIVKDWSQFVRQSSIDHNPNVDILCKMKCRAGCDQDRYVEVS
jgi:MoaA/NifB/PqqE/SkfB family radical SAM enzyme